MNYKFVNRALYFPEEKVLVIADLHIGYEEALRNQGIMLPASQFRDTLEGLKRVFEKIGKVKELIVLGDLKHEFGVISEQEWGEVGKVLDYFKENSEKVVVIRGNHDSMLEPILKRKGMAILDYYVKEDCCFIHGHKLYSECLDKKIKKVILGHRHPAVIISDEYKTEKYKCFLVGKWKKKEIVILPSFFPFVEGHDVLSFGDNFLFIEEKYLKKFDVYVVGDEVYKFGKLGGLI